MKIWVDGGGANLEGQRAKIAVVFEDGKKIVRKLGKLTNNSAEYTALLEALYHPESSKSKIFTDSQLLVGQLTKGWKVNKKHLMPLHEEAKRLLKEKECELAWVRREENLAGKILERERDLSKQ